MCNVPLGNTHFWCASSQLKNRVYVRKVPFGSGGGGK